MHALFLEYKEKYYKDYLNRISSFQHESTFFLECNSKNRMQNESMKVSKKKKKNVSI